VKAVIEALIKLQEIDNEVQKYSEQKEKLSDALDELRSLVEKMQSSAEDKKKKLADVKKWYAEQTAIIDDYKKRMGEIKGSLAGITKTKEYLVRQRELENLRRHKQAKEEEVEKVRATIVDFQDAIEQEERRIDELRGETEREGGSTLDRLRELQTTIDEISSQRGSLLPLIPPAMLRRYEQVRCARDGVAIVYCDDGSCGGCHVQLRAQVFNTLLRRESIDTCPICNRLICVSEDFVTSLQAEDKAE
jgi:hypothetical protein